MYVLPGSNQYLHNMESTEDVRLNLQTRYHCVLYRQVWCVLYVFIGFGQSVHTWKGIKFLRLRFILVHRENCTST